MRLTFLSLFLVSQAQAAYRVYQLRVTTVEPSRNARVEFVLSTLDPNQYESYYSGRYRMRVELIDTWFCPGDTGGRRQVCERPREPVERELSSVKEKRKGLPYRLQPYIPR